MGISSPGTEHSPSNASTYEFRDSITCITDDSHTPQSEVELQAKTFRDCFDPSAFRLEKNFGWMSESQREALGQRADEELKQAYVDHISEMYGHEPE